jgi:putative flavoprotein involved in K+ transport
MQHQLPQADDALEFRFNTRLVKLSRVDPPPRPARVQRATELKEALAQQQNQQQQQQQQQTQDSAASAFSNVMMGATSKTDAAPAMPAVQLAGVALHRMFELVCHVVGTDEPVVLTARQVVLATGPFRVPRLPRPLCDALDAARVPWLHSVDFRGFQQSLAHLDVFKPADTPAIVAVVGAGASGTQIATEIARACNAQSQQRRSVRVFLVGRDTGSLPRRVFGRDIYFWLSSTGALTMDRESFVGKRAMEATRGHGDQLVGSMAADAIKAGVQRVPARVAGWHPEKRCLRCVSPSDQLLGDASRDAVLRRALENTTDDGAVIRGDPAEKLLGNGCWLRADVVLFATGFMDGAARYEFVQGMFADEPAGDTSWHTHSRGSCVTVPGLYVLGEPWQQRADSSLLHGVGVDARHLVDCVKSLHRDMAGRTGSFRELTKLSRVASSSHYDDDDDDDD